MYTIDSYLSLLFKDYSLYFDVARDCYEAYVLYLFYKLCAEYLGGEDTLRGNLEEKVNNCTLASSSLWVVLYTAFNAAHSPPSHTHGH